MALKKKKNKPIAEAKLTSLSFLAILSKYPVLLLIIFTSLIYSNSLLNDYNLDDNLVTHNHRLTSQGIKAIPKILTSPYYSDDMGYKYEYRPLVHITFAIEHDLFGERPSISHAINLLFYLLLVIEVYFFFQRLTDKQYQIYVLMISLIFAAFPLHTEDVCSIKNRDELLGALLGLYTTHSCILSARYRNHLYTLLAVLTLFLGLYAKQNTILFVLLLPFWISSYTSITKTRFMVIIGTLSITGAIFADFLFIWQKIAFVLGLVMISMSISIYKEGISDTIKLIKTKLLIRSKKITEKIHKASSQIYKYLRLSLIVVRQFLNALRELLFKPQVRYILGFCLILVFIVMGIVFRHFELIIIGLLGSIAWISTFKDLQKFYFAALILSIGCSVIGFLFNENLYLYLAFLPPLLIFLYPASDQNKRIALYLALATGTLNVVHDFKNISQIGVLFIMTVLILSRLKTIYFFTFSTITLIGIGSFALMSFPHIELGSITFFTEVLFLTLSVWQKGSSRLVRILIMFNFFIIVLIGLNDYTRFSYNNHDNHPLVIQSLDTQKATPQILMRPSKEKEKDETLKQRPVFTYINPGEIFEKAINAESPKMVPFLTVRRPLNFIETPLVGVASIDTLAGTYTEVAGKYLSLLLLPYPMSFYYGYNEVRLVSFFSFSILLILIIHLLLLFFAIKYYLPRPFLAIGILIYLSGIVLYSNIVAPMAGMMADRFMLIPSLGFVMSLVYLLFWIFKGDIHTKLSSIRNLPRGIKYSFLGLLLFYSVITFSRNFDWKDPITLMRHDIKNVPNSTQAHNLLGQFIMARSFEPEYNAVQKQLWTEAKTNFQQSLEIYPFSFNVAYDLGRVFLIMGQPDSAFLAFKKAETILPDHNFPDLCFILGELYDASNNSDSAEIEYKRFISLDPSDYKGYNKLSMLYYKQKNYSKSIEINSIAIRQIPNSYIAYSNTGQTYLAIDNKDSALYYFQKALGLNPTDKELENICKQLKKKTTQQ